SGALIVGFSAGSFLPGSLGTISAQLQGMSADAPSASLVDSWLAISGDGGVTAYTGKSELGQGISIAQMQLIAEELCVLLARVKLIYSDTSLTPDQGVTSGSQSHPTNFNTANLAQAAATARETLLQLASQRMNAPIARLEARNGSIRLKDDASRQVKYAE